MGITRDEKQRRADRHLIGLLRAVSNEMLRGGEERAQLLNLAADRLEALTGGPPARLGQGVWK